MNNEIQTPVGKKVIDNINVFKVLNFVLKSDKLNNNGNI